MANTRRLLAGRVNIGGKWYGPGPVPEDIAAKIRNPKAWMAEHEATEEVAEVYDRVPGTSSGARLATRVNVDGRWYGPDSEVPDNIAAKIRNPKAWEGGVLPDGLNGGGFLPAGGATVVNDGPDAEPVVAPHTGTDSGEQPDKEPETAAKAAARKTAAKK